jgi:hypothetical protein
LAHEGDELIYLALRPVETGHQANDPAASTCEADSGRRKGLDGWLGHCHENEVKAVGTRREIPSLVAD